MSRPSLGAAGSNYGMSIALSNHKTRWYFELSHRPLQIFLFLLPLVLFYEFGMWQLARTHGHEGVLSITAYEMIKDAMSLFGATALYLPGILLLAVLLIWHLLARHKWEMHLGVPAVMLLESIILALPLVVLNQILQRFIAPIGPAGEIMQLAQGSWESLGWVERLTLSIGAGLYEELLFRMAAIAMVHLILVDVFRQKETIGRVGAVVLSALLFAFYHDLSPGGGAFQWHLAIFYVLAGIFFGVLYIVRGFGVVVGTHAIYDMLVIIALPWLTGN